MTDFRKWDKFDADAAEEEVERKADDEEARRKRIAKEQRALKSCQDRAARLKSEAVARALKAKRTSRRQRSASTTSSDNGNSRHNSNDPSGEKAKEDPASLARASADEAEAILVGLRAGLLLRDEVVAATEGGELHRGVRKARECLLQLDSTQTFLLKATASKVEDDSNRQGQAVGGGSNAKGTCCGGGGHEHSRAHAHAHAHTHTHAHAHSGSVDNRGGRNAADWGEGSPDGRREEEESAKKEMAGALEVLCGAKAACRVAEAACQLRAGRAAESTETLRNLLFEDPKRVPAWLARGESFLVLDAPLLAGLHFDRALELDPGCAAAARHKEKLRRLSSDDSAPAATDVPSGGRDDGKQKRVAAANSAGDGSPAPAEERAVFSTSDDKRQHGAVTAVAAIASSSRGQGGRSTGTGNGNGNGNGNGGSSAAFRRAVAAACENYRAGVVLHQEAFLSSSTEKFLRALELLQVAAAEMEAFTVPHDLEGEPGDAMGEERVEILPKDGDGGEELDRSGAGDFGLKGGVGGRALSSSSGESLDGGAEAIRNMRVGCHLNIAAAFLLRKTGFESALDHCTRALLIHPGNSRALVRRSQAYQELGFFRLTVEDLEAAEASVSAEMRNICREGEESGGKVSKACAEELAEVVKRLEHARWTKVHVGNGQDELPRA
eukprot:g6982.t1